MKVLTAETILIFTLVCITAVGQEKDMSNAEQQHRHELAYAFTDPSETANDTRIQALRDVNTPYTFPGYTKEEWLATAAELRTHILVSNGLMPMLEKTPLNAQVFDRIERADYTVEKVYFEALPGFFTTGNLYRPKGENRTVSGHSQSTRALGQRVDWKTSKEARFPGVASTSPSKDMSFFHTTWSVTMTAANRSNTTTAGPTKDFGD